MLLRGFKTCVCVCVCAWNTNLSWLHSPSLSPYALRVTLPIFLFHSCRLLCVLIIIFFSSVSNPSCLSSSSSVELFGQFPFSLFSSPALPLLCRYASFLPALRKWTPPPTPQQPRVRAEDTCRRLHRGRVTLVGNNQTEKSFLW